MCNLKTNFDKIPDICKRTGNEFTAGQSNVPPMVFYSIFVM